MKRARLLVVSFLSLAAGCGGGGAAPDGGLGGDPDAGPEPIGPYLGGVLASESRPDPGPDGAEIQWGSLGAVFFDGPFPSWHEVTAAEGPCELQRPIPPALCEGCSGACIGPEHCVPYPSQLSAGTITFTGLALPADLATLRPEADGMGGWYYRYGQSGLGTPWEGPPNVFDPGRTITATSTGGAIPAFTLRATGVAAIVPDLPGQLAVFTPGEPFTLRWTPSPQSGRARVRVTVNSSNSFHGEPLPVIIQCDAPDSAGQIAIPASMVDAFPESNGLDACVQRDCPASYLRRYTRATVNVPGGHVELLVEDTTLFGVVHHP